MATLAFKEERSGSSRLFTLAVFRTLDVSIALVGILAVLPVLIGVWIAIRLDSGGPSIFRQCRLGRNGQPFTLHKFRTMCTDADPLVHREYVRQLIDGEQCTHRGDDGQDLYKLASDERITRVGRFLRSTSLDELPQLLDVLRGHMSLVGPRPVIPYEAEMYPPQFEARFTVKPGLTGLWQVNGRNERTYREMLELDLQWAQQHSLRLYLAIVLRTPLVLLRRQGVA